MSRIVARTEVRSLKTEGFCEIPGLVAAMDVLAFEPRFLDPALPSGLWFCDCAESVQAISINAVCLKSSASWDDLAKCQAFFHAFPYVVIVATDGTTRKQMTHELRRRVAGMVFYVARDKAFRGCASVQELRETHGLSAIQEILMDTVELPVYGLLNLADVKPPDMASIESVRSGFPIIDKRIGGFHMGELSVWTGRRGDGKSTLLGEILLDAVDQDCRVCAYSGELPDWKFKYWTSLQAAGPAHIEMKPDNRNGKVLPMVPQIIQEQIDRWLDRRFYLYDIGSSATHDAETILRMFNYAHNTYGCNVFLVDNIMTARFKTGRDADYYRAQSNFVADLVSFVRRASVHVHLVAHPRKTQTGKHLNNDDVGGIGDITNLADNVFSLERSQRKDAIGDQARESVTALAILKNRMWGATTRSGEAIQLQFDPKSKRFYRPGRPLDKRYGWDYQEQGCFEELSAGGDDDVPF